VEPDLALVKYKKLVGGGMIKIVNNTVPEALFKLGYSNEAVDAIVSYIDATGTIEGAPGLKAEHLPVFDCSFKASKGTRSIHYMGHIRMMAATQPFLSGAISKTVNLPNDASVDDIAEAYIESWRQGLKAVAVYRDGSKGTQPLNVSDSDSSSGNSAMDAVGGQLLHAIARAPMDVAAVETLVAQLAAKPTEKVQLPASSLETLARAAVSNAAAVVLTQQDPNAPPRTVRHRLPEERASLTHKFSIAGHEGYITVGMYPNGQPGEIFIKMAKEGSTVSGLMDAFATAISLSLQHGVPLKVLCEKFAHLRFEPSGWTGNEQIGFAKSIMDYIFRWLQLRFLSGTQLTLFAGMAQQQPAAGDGGTKAFAPEQHQPTRGMGATDAPQGGILTDVSAAYSPTEGSLQVEDRGLMHTADAMRQFVDMGDAPSCHTCGAIMVRNGSCYKCVECGSTSGCS
jgi:ribonucleoside-diphosphate reductase alpha chain